MTRPPFDPELAVELTTGPASLSPPTITPDLIPLIQQAPARVSLEMLFELFPDVAHEARTIPGPQGAPDIPIDVFRRRDGQRGGPGFLYLHGGGMIAGGALDGVTCAFDLIRERDAVVVTPTYRVAPQNPDPAPIEDCYATLVWMAGAADELGFDETKLLIGGISAGGGLAAGVTLLARDRSGPALAGQVLLCPMLDDRNDTVSARQMAGVGIWDQGSNATGWRAYLGERAGGPAVSIYAAPARATDLSGLPPTFIDVGSAETFRDEAVAYASSIWAAGGDCELHVHAGGFHGFEFIAPTTSIAVHAGQARDAWLRRLMSRS
jgi:acetyl esterase/lipase